MSSLKKDYFDRLYAAHSDPWNFAQSEYEAEKYHQTIASLPRNSYVSGFELGCSIGVLTSQLARVCEQLTSVDVSAEALRQARERCASLQNVKFFHLSAPAEYPDEAFDLTVVSEVGYYFSLEDLKLLARRIQEHTLPHGQLLLVHWLPKVEDYPLTGDEVHEFFLGLPQWSVLKQFRAPQYRIDVFELKESPAPPA